MSELVQLVKTELYKLFKHRLTWWLLFALVIILGLQIKSLHNKAFDGLDTAKQVDEYMQAHVEMWEQWDMSGAIAVLTRRASPDKITPRWDTRAA